jgi:hypothetical protein
MNGILEKLQRSWQLFKRSIRVIREHPKLLLFPLVMGVLTTMIALFFLVPVGVAVLAPHGGGGGLAQSLVSIASRVYLCALYLYAADGFVAGHYEASQMSVGWKLKKGTEPNGASA